MEAKLPSFVCKYTNSDNVKSSQMIAIASTISATEECLIDWFKCTQFEDCCYATYGDRHSFAMHSVDAHSSQHLYCIYCHHITDEVKTMYSPEALINHMIEAHKHRKYQCNLCLFRAISADHINIHQSVIHPKLHSASLQNRPIDGKICKILECPPIDSTSDSVLPQLTDFYIRFHKTRQNNDGNHDNNYQCIYCQFMNEEKRIVIDHCAQRHADYPILYYNPEPEITSTQSPKINTSDNSSPKLIQEMDLFKETQENRVSSTVLHETIDSDGEHSDDGRFVDDVNNSNKRFNEDNAYPNRALKKQRVSKVQTRNIGPNSALSQKYLNRMKKLANPYADKSSLIKIESRNDKKWRPNSLMKKSRTHVRSRPSLCVSPPPRESVENKAFNSKAMIDSEKRLVCLLCRGNHSVIKASTVSSHIHLYHNTCRTIRTHSQAFCCSHCSTFCGIESEVIVHSKSCKLRSANNAKDAFLFIVSKDEYKTKNVVIHENKSSDSEEEVEKSSKIFHKNKYSDESDVNSDEELERMETNNCNARKGEKKDFIDCVEISDHCFGNSIENEVNIDNESKNSKRLETTIEIALPATETTDDMETDSKPAFVCLFCDTTSVDRESAITHLETHFPDINNAMDDYLVTKPVHKWIKNFIDKQLISFEEMSNSNDNINTRDYSEYQFQCPLCVKIAKLDNKIAKPFKHFWEVKVHYWEHSLWFPIKCKICKPEHDLPNCDHLIVKHLKTKHIEKLLDSQNEWITSLIGDKMKNSCTSEQRLALEKSFISYFRYEILDSQIEKTLDQLIEKQELKLRLLHDCPKHLPKVCLNRLPPINFDDQNMVRMLITNVERQEQSQHKSSIKSNKIQDQIELGSSSDESYDEMPVIIHRKKPKTAYNKLFNDESCDESKYDCVVDNKFSNEEQTSDIEILNENIISGCINRSQILMIPNEDFLESEDRQNIESEPLICGKLDSGGTSSTGNNYSKKTGKPLLDKQIYTCGECDQLFANKNQIKDHFKKEHVGHPIKFKKSTI